ncbi:flagellar filament capping protein FliD [Cellulomonas sp. APG4]|uniref:flagellar filament capping protein FliD n=1 Tax=Cellulomonas sp. APG4 TaxID=1538656 RepID=UPI00137ACCF1|nr:flagellar filament capping protein FliD [Cellulomonas sp. APG4]NCT92763.1 flagellar filament capping protein FliD [Cellulomonas sp. APG4]
MVSMGIDGLASGLDTTSLINQLMQVEAAPQTLLKQKSSQTQSLVTALQGLNTRVASLAEAAAKAAKATSWDAYGATSSSESTKVSVGTGAQPGTVSFHVEQLATAQVSLSATWNADGTSPTAGPSMIPTIPPAVTVRNSATGELVTVEPSTGSLADVARALEQATEAGVKATVVRVSGGENPTYRLQFTGTATGVENGFEVYAGTSAEVTAGTATRLDTAPLTAAQDARVVLWKGAGAGVETTFEQSSNTFSGLLSGVDVTVSAVTAPGDPATTVTVARDPEALKTMVSGVVGTLGVVLSEISSRSATTTTTGADGRTQVKGGLFSGDGAVRGIQQRLISVASQPVDGVSPSEVGIVLGRDGTFTFDAEKFEAALAADPARVQHIASTVASRVAEVATSVSDKYEGSLTLKIQGQESLVRSMGDQIESWDRRLEVRRASLQATYSALEVTLSNLQSQSSWLAGQLSSLPSASS